MKTKKQLINLAESLNVVIELECNSLNWSCNFYTDNHREFVTSDCPSLCLHWYAMPGMRSEFYQSCYDELTEGIKEE